MSFRVSFLNLLQAFTRWEERRELIMEQLGQLRPDVFALNEISVPLQTGRWLQRAARERLGLHYVLLQQSMANDWSWKAAQGLLTQFPAIEAANLDYGSRNRVAQVTRIEVDGRLVDVYVTHLWDVGEEDGLRQYQVQRLLEWIQSRDDVEARIVCGDFNATLDAPSIQLMAATFQSVQTEPTIRTGLRELGESPSDPGSALLSRCIDYIWVAGPLEVENAGRCFDKPHPDDPTLWPSDHAGVWADLEFIP